MDNKGKFESTLAGHYRELFTTPEYSYAASRTTPEALAKKITDGLINGCADKDGDGVKRTCRDLGINHTYRAIEKYLKGDV